MTVFLKKYKLFLKACLRCAFIVYFLQGFLSINCGNRFFLDLLSFFCPILSVFICKKLIINLFDILSL